MSQTILVESNPELRKIYSLNLNTYTGTDVILRNTAADVIELLQILPSIDLLVCESESAGESTAPNLFKYIQENGLEIPMLVLGECKELANEVLCLKPPVDWQLVVKHACDLLGVTQEQMRQQTRPDFVAVGINYFYEIDQTPCDVYIKIQKSDSEIQYVKRLHNQDNFTADDIDKYKAQGLINFYISKDYIQYFVNFVTNNIVKRLEQHDLPLFERISANSSAFTIVAEHVERMGLDNAASELATTSINSMVKAVKESPKLANLLKMLLSNKISYAYQHAHLITLMGEFILSKQSWYEAKHLEILTSAAFFSDITLKSTAQIQVNSMAELELTPLTDKEKEEVLNHAKNASILVRDYPEHTEYLELVIRQHQGMEDGVGFAEEPPNNVHPIAKVFIVADAFVKIMLDPQGPKNKKEILSILNAQFPDDTFQKIIKILEQKID